MTEENRRRNIADEIARADQAWQAARALLDVALYADAISRAYYAAFHDLRGAAPVPRAGSQDPRRGHSLVQYRRLLAGMQRSRELADYDAAVTFAVEDPQASLACADAFRQDALAVLPAEGLDCVTVLFAPTSVTPLAPAHRTD